MKTIFKSAVGSIANIKKNITKKNKYVIKL
jgi:hypothetical protein